MGEREVNRVLQKSKPSQKDEVRTRFVSTDNVEYKFTEQTSLVNYYLRAINNQKVKRDIDRILHKMEQKTWPMDTEHTKFIEGFSGVYEAKGESGARVDFRLENTKFVMLAINDKADQGNVLKILSRNN